MSKLPKDFNWRIYNYLNKDINANIDINNKTAIKQNSIYHYLNYGFYENRKYTFENVPTDFNYKDYVKLNKSILGDILSKHNENNSQFYLEILEHYNNIGFYKKLSYRIEDDVIIINDPDVIIHITHNLNGGTNVYIDNIKKIYDEFKHIMIKIICRDLILINDKFYYIDKLTISNNKIIIIHHLLYYENTKSKYKINTNIMDKIKTIDKEKKLLVIHDYCYFFPSFPNPIKNNNMIPSIEKINNAIHFFRLFKKVIFNSNNCYNNYLKYLNEIDNACVLNSVPDINFYKKRYFPIKKKIYNIGLIGNIGCEHKGRNLVKNIINKFNTSNLHHKFVIFGDYDIILPNLTITQQYNNNDIFKMIHQYDIDYFIFLSIFEETYSFTLSIALHTGLPIIYNNIGAYTERLINYDNCFPFEENEYEKIIDIFKNIENNTSINFENKNIPIMYPEVYNCVPELSKIINKKNNEFNFDVNNIFYNLFNKAVCFINFVNINNGLDIITDQINYIKKTGLYDKLDYIFIIALGKQVKFTFLDYKIKLIYSSSKCSKNEYPVLKFIKLISDNLYFNIKILYIHVKGVMQKPHSYEWRKYLEYFLIEKHDLCLKMLDNYHCVGVNQQYYFDDINKYKNHFSGNFWWVNSSYIKNICHVTKSEDRYVYEHWLIGDLIKVDYRHLLSLHHTPYNLYETPILPKEYNSELIKSDIKSSLKSDYVKTRTIYGVYFICCIRDYFNIVNEQIKLLVKSGLYDLTDSILCFVSNVDDSNDNECLKLLKNYNKIIVSITKENTFEKFAINNFKKFIDTNIPFHIYYMHTKGVTRKEQCYIDWRNLCNYFTISKWRLSIELLNYYDCVGTNLKNFPKKHYSGNYWWSKSEHVNKLSDINDGYLSSEMYICSELKTNYISIFQSYVNHGDTCFEPDLYINISDETLIDNVCIVPDFNEGDKKCIEFCGDIKDGLYYSN
jgi:hypothetical protein